MRLKINGFPVPNSATSESPFLIAPVFRLNISAFCWEGVAGKNHGQHTHTRGIIPRGRWGATKRERFQRKVIVARQFSKHTHTQKRR